jgi:hypothetical protein
LRGFDTYAADSRSPDSSSDDARRLAAANGRWVDPLVIAASLLLDDLRVAASPVSVLQQSLIELSGGQARQLPLEVDGARALVRR